MFYKKSRRIAELESARNELEARNAELEKRWSDAAPYLGFAARIQTETAEELKNLQHDPDMDVVAAAIERVRHEESDKVRESFIRQYRKEHRAKLLKQVRAEIEATEGDALRAQTEERIAKDTRLQAKLCESARAELREEYEGRMKARLTEAEETHIAAEADRQVALELFDMQFRATGKLDMNDPELRAKLRAGDTIKLLVSDPDHGESQTGAIEFKWIDDLQGEGGGWIFSKTTRHRSFEFTNTTEKAASDRFCQIGCMVPDMRGGDSVFAQTLLAGMTPAILPFGEQEPLQIKTREEYGWDDYYDRAVYDYDASRLVGIDFSVRPFEPQFAA